MEAVLDAQSTAWQGADDPDSWNFKVALLGIIAVPTGVVTAELGREMTRHRRDQRRRQACDWDDHDARARQCQQCGAPLAG